MPSNRISTIIVDDDQHAINVLQSYLAEIKDVEVVATASAYLKAKKVIIEHNPDLVFMDVEMPCKNGFELLHEVKGKTEKSFQTIFCTAYEKYTIQALRESALDFLLKPVTLDELKGAIDRFRIKQVTTKDVATDSLSLLIASEIITLPTATGIRFIKKNEIVFVTHEREKGWSKSLWYVALFNGENVRLRSGMTAQNLMVLLGNSGFVQISQSAIVNLNYINTIEVKTRQCLLLPPFANTKLCVSRSFMNEIRSRFECI